MRLLKLIGRAGATRAQLPAIARGVKYKCAGCEYARQLRPRVTTIDGMEEIGLTRIHRLGAINLRPALALIQEHQRIALANIAPAAIKAFKAIGVARQRERGPGRAAIVCAQDAELRRHLSRV